MKTIKLSLILCLVTVLSTSCRVLYDSDFISYYSVSDRYPEGYIIVEQESGVLICPASIVRDYFFAYYQDDFASLDEYLLCLLNNPNAFDFAKHIYSPSSSTNIKRTISRKKLSRKGLCLLEETEYGYMAKLGLTKEQYLTILKKMFDLGYVIDIGDCPICYLFYTRDNCGPALRYEEELSEP